MSNPTGRALQRAKEQARRDFWAAMVFLYLLAAVVWALYDMT